MYKNTITPNSENAIHEKEKIVNDAREEGADSRPPERSLFFCRRRLLSAFKRRPKFRLKQRRALWTRWATTSETSLMFRHHVSQTSCAWYTDTAPISCGVGQGVLWRDGSSRAGRNACR